MINNHIHTPQAQAGLTITPEIAGRVRRLSTHVHYHLPPAAPAGYGAVQYAIPQPTVAASAAPTGRGLTGAPRDEGWPQPAFRTAGGHTIVFEGERQSMKIYGPGQGPDDTPQADIWGDPHVQESDGTRWDFTKDGDVVLPDGTLIAMDTTSETGQSYLDRVTIVTGNDRVEINGIAGDEPVADYVRADGHEWRTNHLAQHAGTDYKTFMMGSREGQEVTFNLFVRGVDQGEVTSAVYNRRADSYEQQTDGGRLYQHDPTTRSPLGSPAWFSALKSMSLGYMANDPSATASYVARFAGGQQAGSTMVGADLAASRVALCSLGGLCLLQLQALQFMARANPLANVMGVRVG